MTLSAISELQFRRAYFHSIDYLTYKIGLQAALVFDLIGRVLISLGASFLTSHFISPHLSWIFGGAFFSEVPFLLNFGSFILTYRLAYKLFEKEIEKAIEDSSKNEKKVLIIESKSTHIECFKKVFGEFSIFSRRLIFKALGAKYLIKVIQVENQNDWRTQLSAIGSHELDMAWFDLHGKQDGVKFSKNFSLNTSNVSDVETLKGKIKPNSFIVFSACSVGKGESNFGKFVSSVIPGAYVFCAEGPISESWGTRIGDQFLPQFFDQQNRLVATKIYFNGRLFLKMGSQHPSGFFMEREPSN